MELKTNIAITSPVITKPANMMIPADFKRLIQWQPGGTLVLVEGCLLKMIWTLAMRFVFYDGAL